MRRQRTSVGLARAALVVLPMLVPPPAGRVALHAQSSPTHPAPAPSQGAAAVTADEIRDIVSVLAADSLEGREAGTRGADGAAHLVSERFQALGLRPPDAGSVAGRTSAAVSPADFLQRFELPPRVDPGPATSIVLARGAGTAEADSLVFSAPDEVRPLAFSASASAAGPLVAIAGSLADASHRDRPIHIRGSVALLSGAANRLSLRARVAELTRAGATGVIVMADPLALSVVAGEEAPVPVLALAPEAAERLAHAAGLDVLALIHGASASAPARATVRLTADFQLAPRATANVVGVLPGRDPMLAGEAVLIGAHYDHLGYGGIGSLTPGVRAIHNGADDNASGVAGVLELAERFAADPPARTLVFAAFGAEEAGLLGSRHYVRAPAWPLERTVAMLNLDMVGRLRQRLTVYGTGTSAEWPALLEDAADGLPLAQISDGLGPSDHATFYAEGVPVLAFFTGAHEDYHRPTDDADRLDPDGEVRVLEVTARVIEQVANARERIAFTQAPVTTQRPRGFHVALGTMPDYGFSGSGLRLATVRPGGPAARAGLKSGDVLLRLAGREISDVYAYTAILADLEAGREVELVYDREGRRRSVTVVPEAR